jgi:hypothetical protein
MTESRALRCVGVLRKFAALQLSDAYGEIKILPTGGRIIEVKLSGACKRRIPQQKIH